MKNLEITTDFCPSLSAEEKQIAQASIGTRLKDISDTELRAGLSAILIKIYSELNQKPVDDEVKNTVNGMIADLRTYFSTITMNDLYLAFHFGIRKEFGDYFGINAVSGFLFVKNYMVWDKRNHARKTQANFILEKNKPAKITDEQKQTMLREGSLHLFNVFKSKGSVDDIGNATYNFLSSQGLIKFTIPRKNEMVQEAIKQLRNQISNVILTAVSNIERSNLKSQSEGITPKSPETLVKAKKIALNQFFKDLVDTGIELSELFDVNN